MLARKTHPFKTKKLALMKALLSKSQCSQQGLSLLECLVAIVIIAAVISAITPPIMISVATRVQNRRAEQARHLAQAKIDEIRRLVETGNYTTDTLNTIAPADVGGTGRICNATSIPFRTNNPDQRVDIDNGITRPGDTNDPNSKYDFWVQAFRNGGVIDPNTNRPVAFDLGVRVYRYKQNYTPNQIKRTSLQFPGGHAPNSDSIVTLREQFSQPLVTLYTKIVLSDTQNSLQSYQTILGNVNPSTPEQCPQ